MRTPEGLSEFLEEDLGDDHCVELLQSIYGLVQSARNWWKKFKKVLVDKLGFKSCKSDPCLLTRTDEFGTVVVCIYVDDGLIVGNKPAIEKALKDIGGEFKIIKNGKLDDYIGCVVKKEEGKIFMHQPNILKKLEGKFKDDVGKLKVYNSPAGTGDRVICPKDEEELMSHEEQTKYRS